MKATVNKKLYEGMFLVDAAEAEADWGAVETNIRNIIEKVDAEIVSLSKWDTCRLAYEIDHKSRGTYILCYFRAEGKRIAEIERTVQLSERIMRVLILSADHVTEEDIDKDTAAMLVEEPEQPTVAGPGETAAEQAEVEAVSAEESPEAEAAPAEVSREASVPVSAEGGSQAEAETAAVSSEKAEESEETEQPKKTRNGRKRRTKTAEAAAEVSEPESPQEDETKDDSESAEGRDEEGTDEK